MAQRFLSGNEAVSLGAARCRPAVIPAYPITPQTTVVEKLSKYVADGELDAIYLNVESEHSAMSAAIGASAMGARVFTATSSQGLLYMCECLHYASGSRFPIVMMNATRSIASPWNIYGDHRDALSQLDSGWIQCYVENAQEALDMVIQGFYIAEHQEVLTPFMLNLDGFLLTHTYEPVTVPEADQVDAFLPPYTSINQMTFEKPINTCITAGPAWNTEFRFFQHEAMERAKALIQQVNEHFHVIFGRGWGGLIETYRTQDAERVLVVLGTFAGTVRTVVDKLREQGEQVGMLKIRFMRPFPREAICAALSNCTAVGVIDRDISFGNAGAVYTNLCAALQQAGLSLPTVNFIAGLGGRNLTHLSVERMFKRLTMRESADGPVFIDLRWLEHE